MEIISVIESNWEELKSIRLAALKDSPNAFSASYEVALGFSEEEWRSRARGTDGRHFFIAKNGLVSIGVIGGLYKTGEYEVISLWVSPEQRGNGVAKMLINSVIQHAKALNKSSIFLEVDANNISACKLYEKHGFSLVSTTDCVVNGTPKTLNKWRYFLAQIFTSTTIHSSLVKPDI